MAQDKVVCVHITFPFIVVLPNVDFLECKTLQTPLQS